MSTLDSSSLLLICALTFGGWASASAGESKSPFTWAKSETSLALLRDGKTVWKLVADPAQGKPYFHPLSTLDGEVLTALRPTDHPWHRGLWWSWKYLNGVNFWEEDKTTGLSEGRTEITMARFLPEPDFSARAELSLSYQVPGKAPLLTESRRLRMSAPAADGTYQIEWTSVFTAGEGEVTLDRTPPAWRGGRIQGGYGGLAVRLEKTMLDWTYTNSEGKTGPDTLRGETARWVCCAGPLSSGRNAAVVIFDHPENPRHPSPWYFTPQTSFFCPAPLFAAPLKMAAKQKLTFRYLVSIHSKPVEAAAIKAEWVDSPR